MEGEGQPVPTSAREAAASRLVGAVVSPRATFESIARKPGWLLPVLLLIVVNAAVAFTSIHRGYLGAYMENQAKSNPTTAGLSPQQRRMIVATRTRVVPVMTYAVAIVGTPLALLIVAAVFLGAFRIGFGAAIKFAQSFSITAYASVPSILKGLLILALMWARPPTGVNPNSVSMSSLAAYLPVGAPMWLVSLGAKLDIFTLWMLVLLAVGYAAASARKARFGSALGVVLVIWIVYLLVTVGFVAGVSSLAPGA
jgi:hypothetical protein